MKCNKTQERLALLVCGELDTETAEKVQAHLAECNQCRELYADLQATLGLLHEAAAMSAAQPELDSEHRAAIAAAGRAANNQSAQKHKAPAATGAKAGATVIKPRRFSWVQRPFAWRFAWQAAAIFVVLVVMAGLLLPSLEKAREQAFSVAFLDAEWDDDPKGNRTTARLELQPLEPELMEELDALPADGYAITPPDTTTTPPPASGLRRNMPGEYADYAEAAASFKKPNDAGKTLTAPSPLIGQKQVIERTIRLENERGGIAAREKLFPTPDHAARPIPPGAGTGTVAGDLSGRDAVGNESLGLSMTESSSLEDMAVVWPETKEKRGVPPREEEPKSRQRRSRTTVAMDEPAAPRVYTDRDDTSEKVSKVALMELPKPPPMRPLSAASGEIAGTSNSESISRSAADKDDFNQIDGGEKAEGWGQSAAVPAQPALPDDPLATAVFKAMPVNPFVLTDTDRFSTFALDTDTASYAIARNYLRRGMLPPAGAIRMEEFINSFDYNYPQQQSEVFGVFVEGAPSPFGKDLVLLKLGVQARRVFVAQMAPTLQHIAKDAKIQVEFNPDRVHRYRLIGYENRTIADEDSRNDQVDAGEVGSGQAVTALYELELKKPPLNGRQTPDLGTVYVRYRDLENAQIRELSQRLQNSMVQKRTPSESPRFFLAACAAEFAEILRDSEHASDGDLGNVQYLLEQVAVELPLDDKIKELLMMVKRCRMLQ